MPIYVTVDKKAFIFWREKIHLLQKLVPALFSKGFFKEIIIAP